MGGLALEYASAKGAWRFSAQVFEESGKRRAILVANGNRHLLQRWLWLMQGALRRTDAQPLQIVDRCQAGCGFKAP